jgi:hypothetical protein
LRGENIRRVGILLKILMKASLARFLLADLPSELERETSQLEGL